MKARIKEIIVVAILYAQVWIEAWELAAHNDYINTGAQHDAKA